MLLIINNVNQGVNFGMSDANALKEELAEVLGGLRRYKNLFLLCLVLPRVNSSL